MITGIEAIKDAKDVIALLAEEEIRKDNPHFGKNIRIVEEEYYGGTQFDFTYVVTVGSNDSTIPNRSGIFDCHASYLWSPKNKEWVLGAN